MDVGRSPSQEIEEAVHRRYLVPLADAVGRLRTLRSALLRGEERSPLASRPHLWVGLSEAPALVRAWRRFTRRHESLDHRQRLLLPLVRAALEFKSLFGTGAERVTINAPRLRLSRRQLLCIVANAFFCTFVDRVEDGAYCLPTINYDRMHAAPAGDNHVEVAKLELLLEYFRMTTADRRAVTDIADVTILRGVAREFPADRRLPCLPPEICALGESIDHQHHMLRLDFANRWIGGGALEDGSVQEEIIFAQCPELNALRWWHGPMADDESIVVLGYRQYGYIQPGTYGASMRYGGALPYPLQLGGALVAVDALDGRFASPTVQYTPEGVRRELLKLMSALAMEELQAISDVAGGNWGCGIFGGDVELKFLIQWLACTWCGKKLHYFPFDNNTLATLAPTLSRLCERGLTTNELLDFLMNLDSLDGGSVLARFVLWCQRTLGALL